MLEGISGVGKTALARRTIDRLSKTHPKQIIWLSATTHEILIAELQTQLISKKGTSSIPYERSPTERPDNLRASEENAAPFARKQRKW